MARLLGIALFATTIHAQETRPPSNTVPAAAPERAAPPLQSVAAGEEDDDVVTLSPFEVAAGNEVGYYAENTLAGSRLNTNLGDLAASITVVTRQQMLDTGSLDVNDVFLYEANTEGTGNYTDYAFGDGGDVRDFTSLSPNTANRVRGIGSPDRAHNYYLVNSAMPYDVYNTESIEINRGPNSLLFGIGSAAGIVNHSTTKANLRKPSYEVAARYGSHDSYRGSFRINQPIIKDKFAIFLAGLYDSRGFSRKPSHDVSRRGYAALTYAPLANTRISANYERYTGEINRPNSITPQDGITEWRAAGGPVYDPLTFTYTVNGVSTTLPNSTIPISVSTLQVSGGNRPFMYYDNSTAELWMQSMLSPTSFVGTFPATHPRLMSSSTFIQRNTNTLPLFRNIGITDRSLYDYTSINYTSGNFTENEANVFNVEVDQRITQNLFLQAGWYRQEFEQYRFAYNAASMAMIDVNTRLLDGTPNPYFGRPFFMYTNGGDERNPSVNDNLRLSLAYKLDFAKSEGWRKWLGTHQFFAIGTRREVDSTDLASQLGVTSDHSWTNPASKVPGQGATRLQAWSITHVPYLGGTDGNITQGGGHVLHDSTNFVLRHAVPGAAGPLAFDSYQWVDEPVTLGQIYHGNTRRSFQKNDSITLGAQSSLLRDRLVTTIGFRRDMSEAKSSVGLAYDENGSGYLSLENLNTWGPSQIVYGNTNTAGAVFKAFPWLSLSYNQSENFSPGALRLDIAGQPLPLPTGEGKDYGVRFSLWDNKLVFNLNFFETTADRARGTPADAFMFRVARFESAFLTWASGVAQERLGTGASDTAIAEEIARIADLPVGYVPPPLGQVGSTSSVEAEGTEFQLIYNPVRNFNIKATFGTQKTVYSQIAPEFDSYVAPRLPVWQAARDVQGNLWWTNIGMPDIGSPSSFWARNVQSPMSLAKALEGKRTQGQREWRASLIATYRFQEGRFNGMTFGGAARLEDDAVIGYYGAAPDPDGVIRSLDPSREIFDNARPTADFWLSKQFDLPKMFGRDTKVNIQLNVRNAFRGSERLEAIAVNPDGNASTFRIIDAREVLLTSTFTF